VTAVRVVRVLGALDIGGVEVRILELLPGLRAAGVEVHLVTLAGRAGVLAARAEQLGARIHPLAISPLFPLRLLLLLRRLRPRAVHSDVATFSGAVLALAALAGVPVRIAHFHSDGDDHGSGARRTAQRWLLRRLIHRYATDVFAVSPAALRLGYRPGAVADARCRVVPNGLDEAALAVDSGRDLRAQLGLDPLAPVCLHVGRPALAKRRWLIPPILAACARSDLHVVLVGPREATDEARVRQAAQTAGVAARVHLLGPVGDVGTLLRQADVLVLPSDREGLPGAVLEAVALGTPVVASDLPGVRYIAAELSGVRVVPLAAPPGAWAAELDAVLRRPPGERDRARARAAFADSGFCLAAAVAELLATYRVVERRGAERVGR
jgi:glycosyltransferase involved in cell wall biosynthesis